MITEHRAQSTNSPIPASSFASFQAFQGSGYDFGLGSGRTWDMVWWEVSTQHPVIASTKHLAKSSLISIPSEHGVINAFVSLGIYDSLFSLPFSLFPLPHHEKNGLIRHHVLTTFLKYLSISFLHFGSLIPIFFPSFGLTAMYILPGGKTTGSCMID
jgi:hypothetical protein